MPRATHEPFSFTSEQREKIGAAVAERDFYDNLTDDEREEEGLPTRETPKPAAPKPEAPKADEEPEKPAAAEKPAVPEAPAAEPEAEPEEGEAADELTRSLLEEIAGLREDLGNAIVEDETGEAPRGREPDPLLAAAKDHDDPVVRGLAERLEQAEGRLAQGEQVARLRAINEQKQSDDREFAAVEKGMLIGGQPMTKAHVEQLEDFMLENQEIARRLSIEQVTRVVFPDAVRAGKPSPPENPTREKTRAKGTGSEAPTATIVDAGSSGGAPAPGWKPKPNDTIESSIRAAGRRFGWIK